MKRKWQLVGSTSALVGFLAVSTTFGSEDASDRFAQLKSLVGEWEAKLEDGHKVRSSFRLISNGTALMESINDASHQDMVTIYHPAGDELMATHYCSSDNQPRMKAAAMGDSLAFSMVDVTNLTMPGQRHIRKIVFTFEDEDHYIQEYTQREDGEDTVETLHFVRRR